MTSIIKFNNHSIALVNDEIILIEEVDDQVGPACRLNKVDGCSLVINAGDKDKVLHDALVLHTKQRVVNSVVIHADLEVYVTNS